MVCVNNFTCELCKREMKRWVNSSHGLLIKYLVGDICVCDGCRSTEAKLLSELPNRKNYYGYIRDSKVEEEIDEEEDCFLQEVLVLDKDCSLEEAIDNILFYNKSVKPRGLNSIEKNIIKNARDIRKRKDAIRELIKSSDDIQDVKYIRENSVMFEILSSELLLEVVKKANRFFHLPNHSKAKDEISINTIKKFFPERISA